jgi:hypothetical protein
MNMMSHGNPLIQLSQLLEDMAECCQPAKSDMKRPPLDRRGRPGVNVEMAFDEDNRKAARYFVTIPARIRIGTQTKQNGQKILAAETINISADGALFDVDCRITEGTCVSVDLNFGRLGQAKESIRRQTVVINIIGRVLRNEPAGLGIAFDSEFRMVNYDKTA